MKLVLRSLLWLLDQNCRKLSKQIFIQTISKYKNSQLCSLLSFPNFRYLAFVDLARVSVNLFKSVWTIENPENWCPSKEPNIMFFTKFKKNLSQWISLKFRYELPEQSIICYFRLKRRGLDSVFNGGRKYSSNMAAIFCAEERGDLHWEDNRGLLTIQRDFNRVILPPSFQLSHYWHRLMRRFGFISRRLICCYCQPDSSINSQPVVWGDCVFLVDFIQW